ncbi:MAG: response regulator [Bermanella sp.]
MDQASKILFVDDEAQMLSALARVFRGQKFAVTTANSGKEGLALLADQQFDVIISDMRMPEMDGASFLAQTCKLSPSSRRVLLTGFSDQESTIRAINQGQVHQYLSKPWDNQQLRNTIEAELAEKQRIQASTPDLKEYQSLKEQVVSVSAELASATSFADMAKEELLDQYNTTIKLISNLINLRMPSSYSANCNVVNHSVALAKLVKLDSKVITEVRNAARLHQLGKLAFDDSLLLMQQDELSPPQLKQYQAHSVLGADLLTPLNSLDYTAKLIRHQNENYDGSGSPQKLSANKIPLGSRILRLAIDYQMLLHGRYFKDALSCHDALAFMADFAGKKYDPELLRLYQKLIIELEKTHPSLHYSDHRVSITELRATQVVNRDLLNHDGMLLIAKGTHLNNEMIDKLTRYCRRDGRDMSVFIQLPSQPR